MLVLANSESWEIVVKAKGDLISHEIATQYIRFYFLGGVKFEEQTPREAWEKIIDLEKSDAAISESGHLHLGVNRKGKTDYFTLTGSNELKDTSQNISFTMHFCLYFGDTPVRRFYCKIDPLIKTSSAHR